MNQLKTVVTLLGLFAVIRLFTFAQTADDLSNYNEPPSRLRGVIEKFSEDYGSLNRFYTAQTSPNRSGRLRQLFADWLAVLNRLQFDALNHDEQVDYLLFKNYLAHELKESERENRQFEEMFSTAKTKSGASLRVLF